jgi:8-oxo-dGTP pyrophosphatase MutT (NUDIX family)
MAQVIIRKVQVIVYCRAPEIQVLLLQRPPDRGSIWQPVTGKMEPDDRNFMHSAARELEEETGITDVLHFVETGVEFHFEAGEAEVREHLVGAEVERCHSVTLSDEHVAYAWLPPLEASERLAWETNREGLQVVLLSAG